jgi:hypothetical protein
MSTFVTLSLATTLQELWACEDGDLLLPIIAEYLRTKQMLLRFGFGIFLNEELIHQQPQAYPEGQFDQAMHLLQTNVIVPHFDLMMNRNQH